MEAIRDLLKHSEAQPQPATAKVLTWTFQVSQGSSDRNLGHCFNVFQYVSLFIILLAQEHCDHWVLLQDLQVSTVSLENWWNTSLLDSKPLRAPSTIFHVCPGILRWGSAGNSMGQTSTRAVGSIQLDVAWFARAKKMSETQRGWQMELPLTGSAVKRNYGNYSYDLLWHAWEKKTQKNDSDGDMVNNSTQTQMMRVTKWFAKIVFFF